MDDEDERVTEFVSILSNAVEREAENKSLQAQRDELLKALQWYAEQVEGLNLYGMASDLAEIELRRDRGKRAKEAIAKAKGSQSYPQKRMKVRDS